MVERREGENVYELGWSEGGVIFQTKERRQDRRIVITGWRRMEERMEMGGHVLRRKGSRYEAI